MYTRIINCFVAFVAAITYCCLLSAIVVWHCCVKFVFCSCCCFFIIALAVGWLLLIWHWWCFACKHTHTNKLFVLVVARLVVGVISTAAGDEFWLICDFRFIVIAFGVENEKFLLEKIVRIRGKCGIRNVFFPKFDL